MLATDTAEIRNPGKTGPTTKGLRDVLLDLLRDDGDARGPHGDRGRTAFSDSLFLDPG